MPSKATQNFVKKCKSLYEEADTDGNGLTIQELRVLICKLCNNDETTDSAMAEIFAGMDKDGDNKLSWDEFSEVCNKKDPKTVQEEELRAAFKTYDKDGSGRLSKDEIQKVVQEQECKCDAQKILDAADADGDGKISFEEFLAAWK